MSQFFDSVVNVLLLAALMLAVGAMVIILAQALYWLVLFLAAMLGIIALVAMVFR